MSKTGVKLRSRRISSFKPPKLSRLVTLVDISMSSLSFRHPLSGVRSLTEVPEQLRTSSFSHFARGSMSVTCVWTRKRNLRFPHAPTSEMSDMPVADRPRSSRREQPLTPAMDSTRVFRRSRVVMFLNMERLSLSVLRTEVKDRSSTERGNLWNVKQDNLAPWRSGKRWI